MHIRRLLAHTNVVCNTTDCGTDANIGISVMALSLGVILAMSVAANGVVCFVFYKKSNLLSVSNSFVLNLSVCQLVLAVLVLPFTLTSVFSSGWIFNETWCKIQGYLFTVCIVGIQLSLTVISLDRNYAIINSLRYIDVFTQRLANILIASCWMLSLVLSTPPLIGWGAYTYIENQFTCSINWKHTEEFLVFFSVVCFLVPILVQSICYLSIFKAAIRHTKRASRVFPSLQSTIKEISSSIPQDPSSDSSDNSDISQSVQVKYRNMECKAVRTILLIAFAYALCWAPYLAVSFLRLRSFAIESYGDSLATSFLFLTGVINPVIYVFMNRITRNEINKFFCDTAVRDVRKSSSVNDSGEIGSTTITTNFSSARNNGSSSSGLNTKPRSSSLTRTDSMNRSIVEMKTIKEELEYEDVIESVTYVKPKTSTSRDFEYDRPKSRELFLDPAELYLQRKKIRSKHEKLTAIKEEMTNQHSSCPPWADIEELDVTWNPSSKSRKRSHFPKQRQHRANKFLPKCDETFSKRKKKDFGSFLYFENSPVFIKHSRRSFGRGGRLSLDETSFRNADTICRTRLVGDKHQSLHGGVKHNTESIVAGRCRITAPSVIEDIDEEDLSVSDPELSRISCTNEPNDRNISVITPSRNEERNCMSA